MDLKTRVDGVMIGVLIGFDAGRPLVAFAANPMDHALPARSLCTLGPDDTGAEVALLFEDGAPERPLIVGRIVDPVRDDALPPAPSPGVVRDGETVRVTATDRIELRVGKSAIVMEKDGHITIRGTYLVSHASTSNRIRGGSVNLN